MIGVIFFFKESPMYSRTLTTQDLILTSTRWGQITSVIGTLPCKFDFGRLSRAAAARIPAGALEPSDNGRLLKTRPDGPFTALNLGRFENQRSIKSRERRKSNSIAKCSLRR